MPEIHLTGCAPTPLSHYLKALGILRLVGEQADSSVTGRWEAEHFVLASALDADSLINFVLKDYCPTPIVAPWNGGSGFYPKDNVKAIEFVGASHAARLGDYAEVIAFSKALVSKLGLSQSPKGSDKAKLLARFRGGVPRSALNWFDAAVLLSGEEPRYPPLLGTGGNDGRLDFTNNFMQRVIELIQPVDGEPTAQANAWLPGALFGEATPGLLSSAIGQFNPGGVGGPNAGTGYEADSLINPWDFVLMLEGALLFATAASRRLENTEPGGLAYPFTVRNTGAGGAGASWTEESNARHEIWLPLWRQPAGLPELCRLLSEGRVRLGRRSARDGLDFARAVAALGVDRGINAFQRYGFLMRSGKAYLATPLARIEVRRNPDADLISDLAQGGFLDRLRRRLREENTPGRLRLLGRRLDEALLALAERGGSARIQAVSILLGAIVPHLSRLTARDNSPLPPMPRLDGGWVVKGNDGTSEFIIAAALAGLYARGIEEVDRGRFPALVAGLPMACHVAPVELYYKTWRCLEDSKLYVWAEDRLTRNLARMVERRLFETRRANIEDKPFDFRVGAPTVAVASWLTGRLDERRIADLVTGLCLAHMPDNLPEKALSDQLALPAAYVVLKPFFTPDRLLRHLGFLPPDGRLPLADDLISLLRAERIPDAIERAWLRLRTAGVALPKFPQGAPKQPSGLSGERLLAALIVPLHFPDLADALRRLTPTRKAESLTA